MTDLSNLTPDQADCLFDRATIDKALDAQALALTHRLENSNPLAMVVLHGGLIYAGHLLTRLNFRLQQDYIHATRYRGEQTGSPELHWLAPPHSDLEGRSILLLDDIFDEGHTLQAIREYCLGHGAEEVVTAVLLTKLHDRGIAIKPDYSAMEVEDRYVFGFGMDLHHSWRNANGIYAVKEL